MLFNSLPYLFLFSLTYLIYWNVGQKWKKITLLVASIIFYAYFHILFLFHFLAIIGINYWVSQILWTKKESGADTSSVLRWIVAANVINLAVFKYFYFVTDSLYLITGLEAIPNFSQRFDIFLPLAISFYSFQLIALQVDIHRGIAKEKISFYDYSIFILFFPQLIAGPIMRTDNFLPQLNNPSIDPDRMKKGLFLIVGGLFKKVVIAENISGIIYPVYANPGAYDSYSLWLSMIGFVCQVYCDFSGYTDLARGSANLLGYEIPENFRGPFFSQNFKDLFTRWHVTLSTWLRDYIYIPLGGNKYGFHRSNWNLVVTNTLGGLWHGANFGFVIWGFYLGILIGIERTWERFRGERPKSQNPAVILIRGILVFIAFSYSGVFFRCAARGRESLSAAIDFTIGMFQIPAKGIHLDRVDEIWTFLVFTYIFNFCQYSPYLYTKLKPYQNILLPVSSVIILLLLGIFGDGGKDFIYFQF